MYNRANDMYDWIIKLNNTHDKGFNNSICYCQQISLRTTFVAYI